MALCGAIHEPVARNLLKNKYLLIMWLPYPPGSKPEFERPAPEPFELARLIRFPGGFLDPNARSRKSLRLPSLTEEIHASTEVRFCFWSWPHSFLRCFPPARSRILLCDRTIPLMYVRTNTSETFAEAIGRGPGETALGSFSVVLSAIESDGNMFCSGRSKPSARESFECLRVGAEPCAPCLPIPAQHRPARAPMLPPECHRIFGRSRSVRKSIRA